MPQWFTLDSVSDNRGIKRDSYGVDPWFVLFEMSYISRLILLHGKEIWNVVRENCEK